MKSKFKVGDRVSRRENVFDEKSQLRTGTVIERYWDLTSRFGPYHELYRVEWDYGRIQGAFLPHELDPVATPPPLKEPL